jgi:putative transposase
VTEDFQPLPNLALGSMPNATWQLAARRFGPLAPFARQDHVGTDNVELAASELGLSTRHVWTLIAKLREGEGVVTDLVPGQSDGGRGKSRLPDAIEDIMAQVIDSEFRRRQKPSASAAFEVLQLRCLEHQIPAPSESTFRRRIAARSPASLTLSREGVDAVRKLKPSGTAFKVSRPLEQIQIDHTWMNVVVVDELHRQAVGRPYFTLAIDVYSRAILGFVITLEPPSALSVGLCLTQVVSDKRDVVQRIGGEVDWPMAGIPLSILMDNAKEFHSEALRRGAEQYGIELKYRRLWKVEDGAVVERGVKTANDPTHGLPGTTFANIVDRGSYNSEETAALTVSELQRWFLLKVSQYHERIHSGVGESPRYRWQEAVGRSIVPRVVSNPKAFLIEFLPVERRRLTRSGLQLDYIEYYADSLRPLVERAKSLDRLIIRRNPTNLSRIWVLDPLSNHYLEVPYKNLERPPISLHEHRLAIRRLKESARSHVDEDHIFRMIREMRELVDAAKKSTKSARRQQARRPPQIDAKLTLAAPHVAALPAPEGEERIQRFAQIEEW